MRRSSRGPGNNFRDFNEVTRGAEKVEGLFTLYKTGDHLYAEIRPDQFNQPLLDPGDHRPRHGPGGDARRRRRPRADLPPRRRPDPGRRSGTSTTRRPPARRSTRRSSRTTPTRCSWPCRSSRINPMRGGAALIDLSDVFMTDFAQIGLGSIDRSRSQWSKVKGFPNNMELELEATYTGGYRPDGHRPTATAWPTPRDHPGAPLQHHEGPGHGLPSPRSPTTASATSSARPRTSASTTPTPTSSATSIAGGSRSPTLGQALAAQEADHLVRRGHRPARVPPLRRGGHQRVEQGVREDRLPQRDRRPLAGRRPRRVRPGGHELLHVPLGHQRRRLRHVVPAGQPDDRRDDRRRRRSSTPASSATGSSVRPADRQHARPPTARPRPRRWPSAR